MGKLIFEISDDLEKSFRDTVFRIHGMHKGNLKKCFEESMREWIIKNGGQP